MKTIYTAMFMLPLIMAWAQQEFPLYGAAPIPNSKAVANQEKIDSAVNPVRYVIYKVSHPTLTIYSPPVGQGNGTAVIICPGGLLQVVDDG